MVNTRMALVNCNLCGADDYTVLFPEGFAQLHRIVRCNRCSLMYANPQKAVDCDTFTDPALAIDADSPHIKQYVRKQHIQLADNLHVLRRLNEHFPGRGRLLEIGAFMGIFLDQIRSDGWDVTGLEPFSFFAKYAREKLQLNIIEDILPNANLPDAAFEAVVMLHVIEHVPNPAETIREIRRILKPGGMLVIETPRFDSLMFKLLGRRERSISNCNGHVYFFTVASLTRLLERNGFRVCQTDLVGRTLTADRLLYNLGVISRRAGLQKVLERLGSSAYLQRVRLHVNVRDMQQLYCVADSA